MRTLLAACLICPPLLAAAQVLTADEAVRAAVENNHGVRMARLGARTAELMNSVGNAGMLPVVDLAGSYAVDNSSTRQTFFSGDVREADNADQRVLDAAVQLNWTVFDGLAMFASKGRLAALEEIGRTQLRQRIESTVYDVLSTYYQLVQVRKAIEVQREAVRVSRERESIAAMGERIGSTSGLQLVQARLDLNTDSARALDLTAQEAVAQARLNALLGRDPSVPVAVEPEVPTPAPMDLAEVQRAARQANGALQQARQQQIAADLGVKEMRGALLPRLDVFANYGYTRSTSAVGFLSSNRALGPDYGARISVPLFRGLQARRAMEAAKLGREQAAAGTEQAALDLEEGVLNAWTNYTLGMRRTALEEGNLGGVRTQADVALESYRVGAISGVELREVQQGLVDAEHRLLLARYEAKLAELQLRWLSGRLP